MWKRQVAAGEVVPAVGKVEAVGGKPDACLGGKTSMVYIGDETTPSLTVWEVTRND